MWLVYTRTNCAYCMLIKERLKDERVEYVDYDTISHSERNKLKSLQSTLPIAFHNGYYIGGYSDVVSYLEFK